MLSYLVKNVKKLQKKIMSADNNIPIAIAVPVFSEESGFSEKVNRKSGETMLLLDITGSMEFPANASHSILREKLVKDALKLVVKDLQDLDTAGKDEDDGGGVMTTTFANGHGQVLGDLNPDNFEKLWSTIRFGGSTQIMPGWNAMLDKYNAEFEDKDKSMRPLKIVTVVTDGEAEDVEEFTRVLAGDRDAYVCMILIGCDLPGNDHGKAIRQFEALAVKNPRIVFNNFTNCVDPKILADTIRNVCMQAV